MAAKRKATTAPTTEEPLPPHLQPGSEVEISSNDPGFRGSWFTGTIIKRAPQSARKNSNSNSNSAANKFVVQYTHLFEDEAGTMPLQETINAADLRPLAPRERARKFKFGEEVDAYHDDGWWEGVITKELENGKFDVYFKGSKEQLEFGEDQLRLHREWANGSWDPPLEEEEQEVKGKFETGKAGNGDKLESGKIPTEQIFKEGARVEVSSNEEGFEGAWFTGTIVNAVGKDRYLVQYESLRNEDDTDFLREENNTLQIRPSPPIIDVARFKKHQEVDALYNDGWWVGVISRVLSNSKYIVYFRNTKEKLTFKHSDLRLHQDWIDGKWVAASQEVQSEKEVKSTLEKTKEKPLDDNAASEGKLETRSKRERSLQSKSLLRENMLRYLLMTSCPNLVGMQQLLLKQSIEKDKYVVEYAPNEDPETYWEFDLPQDPVEKSLIRPIPPPKPDAEFEKD
ncbi:hypothetical protein CCACVL1_09691 [Corchorus capsularis]|uniref:Agenet domain-containing protein n=1 Tax=Corchorus capsularis TaxID=210143 RepID=A0A1R3IUI9_COCAP|nr:hypothetical protein CCACVL1_09691 [Corchorus capsularis]